MPLKRFEKNDIFKNVVKANPRFELKISSGLLYVNNSLERNVSINNLLIPIPAVGGACVDSNSFDFSCEENSYNIATI